MACMSKATGRRLPEINGLLGIPFVNHGRTVQGCDCWGLTILAFRAYGVEVPDYHISCFATARINDAVEASRFEWRRIRTPEAPCLVVMRTDPDAPGDCSHLGVYVGNGELLHTIKKQNSHIDRIDHPWWSRRIEGFYVFQGKGGEAA